MILRPYQKDLVDRAETALRSQGNTLAVAATGAGKTIMLASLASRFPGRQLVLQHRQELVRQNMAKFRQVNPGASVSLWTAETKSFRGDATFAMVQSLAGHVDRMPRLDLVIADEAHHVAAPTWRRIIAAAREKNPDCMVAGFTATPMRTDGRGLRSVFSNVCRQVTIRELVQLGFLVPPRGFVINVEGTQDALRKLGRQSDFGDQDEVEALLNTVAVNDEVVRHWKEKAADRQTIVFCSTVKHAEDVAEAFRRAGAEAAVVHGGMPAGKRKAVLRAFSSGAVRVLTNVAVLTEGYDHPPVSCVILLRQCSEKGPLIQMAGRGLRTVDPEKFPGVVKKDCLILDFGTSLLTHGDLAASAELKEDREEQDRDQDGGQKECPGCHIMVPSNARECPVCGFVFSGPEKAEVSSVELCEMDILNASPFRYVDIFQSDRVLIATGFHAWAGVFSPDGENWYALGHVSNGRVRTLMRGERLQCMSAADDFLRENETEDSAQKNRRWLDQPASEKQLGLLAGFGYDVSSPWAWTKYAASCHTAFQFARGGIEKALGVAS